MNLFGARLKDLRLTNHMTQSDLGKAINVTKVSICCYEKGTRLPSLETLVHLSEVFKVSIDYLLGSDELIVSDNDESYGAKMATEEITFIKEIRKYDKLYEQMIADPKRFVELINIKLK